MRLLVRRIFYFALIHAFQRINAAPQRKSHKDRYAATLTTLTRRSYAPPNSSATVYGSPEVSLKRAVNSLTPFLVQVSR